MTHSTQHSDPSPEDWLHAGLDYPLDRWQHTFLMADIMRQRGNDYLAHLRAGQPPVLVFDYEPVLGGRDFDPPVNYTLLKICDRRTGDEDRRSAPRATTGRRQGPHQEKIYSELWILACIELTAY